MSTAASPARLVLVVDPNAHTRAVYRTALEAASFDVEEAEDGREALVVALSRRPLCLITETLLPFINGCDLCTLLRRDDTTSNVRLILLSADGLAIDRRRAPCPAADAVLVKPCPPERLVEEVRRLVGGIGTEFREPPHQ